MVTKLVCFLLILAQSSWAISPRRDSLRAYTYTALGLPSTNGKLTTANVNMFINESAVEVSRDFPAIEKFDTVLISKTGEGAALNSDFLRIHRASRIIGDTLRIPLDVTNPDSLFEKTGGLQGVKQDRDKIESPHWYSTFGKRFQTHPKGLRESGSPDKFLIEYFATPNYLGADSDTTLIPDDYRPALLLKVRMKALIQLSDFRSAFSVDSMYNEMRLPPVSRREELKR